MRKYSFFTWASIIVVCSFIGFLIENVWQGLRDGYFDNRNMYLPFLLGYGLAVMFFYAVLGLPEEFPDVKYFVAIFIMVSLGELLLGNAVEKICGIYYWDYSTLPLHLTRYTSLFTSIGFAILITAFMRYVFPKLGEELSHFDGYFFKCASVIMLGLLVADLIVSFYQMETNSDFHDIWHLILY